MLKALVTVIVIFFMIMAEVVIVPVQSQKENDLDKFLQWKKTVTVLNEMQDGIIVYLHCKSKDDDLGPHVLGVGDYQRWSFKDNFSGSTLFWCSMQASNLQAKFEIYSAKADEEKCNTQCIRSLKNDGAYFYNQFESTWEKRLSWNIGNKPI